MRQNQWEENKIYDYGNERRWETKSKINHRARKSIEFVRVEQFHF